MYNEYKNFWYRIKKDILVASQRDKDRDLIFGANSHQYKVFPTASKFDIDRFEKKHNISLPSNYKAYLQYFGAGGAGPDNGIYNFFDKKLINSIGDLSTPSQLLTFTGCNTDVNEDHPIHQLNGVIKIGTAGNPTDYFLTITGKEKGNVFSWNYDDILCCEGLFEYWYQAWLDNILS